jgi:hypothetical protein
MEHAALVRSGHAGADLPRHLDRLLLRKTSDSPEQRRQILTCDIGGADGRSSLIVVSPLTASPRARVRSSIAL